MATANATPKVNHIGLPILEYRGREEYAVRRLRA